MILLLAPAALAGDFVDTWVTSAFEDTNLMAGPEYYSPAPNFVTRGADTFFENYESAYSDDITHSHLVLYRKDEGFIKNTFTEAAFVIRLAPYIDPDNSKPGVSIKDDGSYVRIGWNPGGKKETALTFTGYVVDANRFRLGYSYDLTWGGRDIYAFDPSVAPGARLQFQHRGASVFVGVKTAVGDFTDPDTGLTHDQAYLGVLGGGAVEIGRALRIEAGVGDFQQGQLTNVGDVTSPNYNAPIYALGGSAQVAVRTTPDLAFITSNDLKLYRNAPEFVSDTYIVHRQVDGFGLLAQAEGNFISHNLLDPENVDSTIVESAFAGDLQTLAVLGTTELQLDAVYKDLSYIVFNIPGVQSGYALSSQATVTPEFYFRARLGHWFPKAHLTPSLGVGFMIPASYTVGEKSYVYLNESTIERPPDGYAPSNLLSGVASLQWDVSNSIVAVGEVLYTLDNNQSDYVYDDSGVSGENVPVPTNVSNALGMKLMLRARF